MLTFDELANGLRGVIRRARLTGLTTDSNHLRGAFSGMVGHQPQNVVAPHTFGFYAEPPAGASALLLALGGRHDALYAIAFDHPQYRPAWQGGGAAVMHDANGNSIALTSAGIAATSPTKIVLTVGGCSLTITSSGFAFKGGTITHDGHAIDKTHVHTLVTPGSGNSGSPP